MEDGDALTRYANSLPSQDVISLNGETRRCVVINTVDYVKIKTVLRDVFKERAQAELDIHKTSPHGTTLWYVG